MGLYVRHSHQTAKLALATSHELPATSLCAARQAQAPPPGGGLQPLPMEAASEKYMADCLGRVAVALGRPSVGRPCAHANGLWPFLLLASCVSARGVGASSSESERGAGIGSSARGAGSSTGGG
jgi:hypothetical protein